ncbi:hypothetical protein D3C86_2088280 [compost metagenome]
MGNGRFCLLHRVYFEKCPLMDICVHTYAGGKAGKAGKAGKMVKGGERRKCRVTG